MTLKQQFNQKNRKKKYQVVDETDEKGISTKQN